MKNILFGFGLILLACGIQAQVVNICYDAQDGVFIPDFTNCSNYYACVGQVGYLQSCPSGYAFDSSSQACNYASDVTCTSCPSIATGLTFISVPAVCDKYVICAGGSPFMQTCYDGLEFNSDTNQCDFASNVKCTVPAASCPSTTSNVLTFIPNGGACTRYTICYKGSGYVQTCSSGLIFSPTQNNCVLPSYYTCPTSTSSTTSSRRFFARAFDFDQNELMSDASRGCPAVGSKSLPIAGDCSRYAFCAEGKSTVLSCAGGLHFDADFEVCRPASESNCKVIA